MTREEQIHNYAYNNCITEDVDDNSYSLIVDAIKWADETVIERACKWLQLNAIKYIRSIGGCMYFDVINSVNDLKKAMEE